MKKYLSTVALASISFMPMVSAPTQANAYQIDCAILLCLSGGWPASAPCAAARAEFIRRITPWPVEPPLQIWRCPMSISYEGEAPADPMGQLYDIMAPAQPRMSYPVEGAFDTFIEADAPDVSDVLEPTLAVDRRSGGSAMPEDIRLFLAQAVGTGADIDVSSTAFDFIRSIDVFQVQMRQWESGRDGDCNRYANIRHGTYDINGQFRWRNAHHTALPAAFVGDERYYTTCPNVWTRAVFVDWADYEGTYGFEQVNY